MATKERAALNALVRAAAAALLKFPGLRACFDTISHGWLLAPIPMEHAILRKWLKVGFVDKHAWYPTDAGTPQGGICSPVLANMTLDGLECRLRERFPTHGKGKTRGLAAKVHLIRFADDFIITGASKELLEDVIKPLVERFMQERGLTLSPEKTVITQITEGFDFLGQHLRKYGDKLLLTPSKKNVHTLLSDVRATIKAHATATAGHLIHLLNPKIRG